MAAIDPIRVTRLPHPMLDAKRGGPIITRREDERDLAIDALYRFSIAFEPGSQLVAATGAIRRGRIEAEPQSFWQQWLRRLLAVLVRESGFCAWPVARASWRPSPGGQAAHQSRNNAQAPTPNRPV